MLQIERIEIPFGSENIIVEIGKVAKQAAGSCMVYYGDTAVLVTAVSSSTVREDIDFVPLVVDFEERFYAAGKIPGGFIKREGRPRTTAILNARLVDRSLRPLFSPLFQSETQIVSTVLSVDEVHPPDVISIVGASIALALSDIPFEGPVGACRIGMVDQKLVINPGLEELTKSSLDMLVAGTDQGITMIEAGASEVAEETIAQALEVAYSYIKDLIKVQVEIQNKLGKAKKEVVPPPHLEDLGAWLKECYQPLIRERIAIPEKVIREQEMNLLLQKAKEEAAEKFESLAGFGLKWEETVKEEVQALLFKTGHRQDGRSPKEIRPISCETGVLPRTHGSSLFTRGQTQALVITTLGATSEEQKVDGLQEEEAKRFMLHYNFPPYSTGEVRPMRGPGRREIGHGALAERALEGFIPSEEDFPYTIRVVSEILESNGSSSMATVCGASLSLMDAGIPIKTACAGLSIGLMASSDQYFLLRDILGSEDHYGEMDFKVAGSESGITAIQLDVKNRGLAVDILKEALTEAKEGRTHILGIMNSVLEKPRGAVSPYAPKIGIVEVKPDRIGALIGPGGKVIKKIVEETGVTIDIQDNGKVLIFSRTDEGKERALQMINSITQDVEVGKVYLGKVTRVTDFGAFVEIFPGREGLCHVSQLSKERVRKVEDFVKVGDDLLVKVTGVDSLGRINLSHKEAQTNISSENKNSSDSQETSKSHQKRR